jgi:hypothetical protein
VTKKHSDKITIRSVALEKKTVGRYGICVFLLSK